ncbi:MAG TPA: hypothetical protein PLL86_11365, partial [Leptospiraceae bacterium]|nr:hypothetical protein [Leptospiraceae bacterium]
MSSKKKNSSGISIFKIIILYYKANLKITGKKSPKTALYLSNAIANSHPSFSNILSRFYLTSEWLK